MPPSGRGLFVTGVTGFVGAHLLPALQGLRDHPLFGLTRRGGTAADAASPAPGWTLVTGDLGDPSAYRSHLAQSETVIHLAATTGKARPATYFAVNVEGTRVLLDECRRAGVSRFVFVSSIAAGFPEQRHYPYAQSKLQAEELVQQSGLGYVIVRPTMILGPGSPVGTALAKLAQAPMVPVFGDGRVWVQPIHVEDLVAVLLLAARDPRFIGQRLEVGGPEALTLEELLRRIAAAAGRSRVRVLHLPFKPIQSLLAMLEPVLLPVLPLTAGQLASFGNDGTARPHPFLEAYRTGLRTIDDMLAPLRDHA